VEGVIGAICGERLLPARSLGGRFGPVIADMKKAEGCCIDEAT
jgi:hypothetical protein